MKTCDKCGKKLTLLNRDLTSSTCASCAREEQQRKKDEQRIKREAEKIEAEEQDRIEKERRIERIREWHGITKTYPKGCPDCGGMLNAITLFGREEFNLRQGLGVDSSVQYFSDATAEQGIFTGRFSISGEVRASMCDRCHRIFLHGVPRSDA